MSHGCCVDIAVASGLRELCHWSNVSCALSIRYRRRWQDRSCWRRRVFAGDRHYDYWVYVFQRHKEHCLCESDAIQTFFSHFGTFTIIQSLIDLGLLILSLIFLDRKSDNLPFAPPGHLCTLSRFRLHLTYIRAELFSVAVHTPFIECEINQSINQSINTARTVTHGPYLSDLDNTRKAL